MSCSRVEVVLSVSMSLNGKKKSLQIEAISLCLDAKSIEDLIVECLLKTRAKILVMDQNGSYPTQAVLNKRLESYGLTVLVLYCLRHVSVLLLKDLHSSKLEYSRVKINYREMIGAFSKAKNFLLRQFSVALSRVFVSKSLDRIYQDFCCFTKSELVDTVFNVMKSTSAIKEGVTDDVFRAMQGVVLFLKSVTELIYVGENCDDVDEESIITLKKICKDLCHFTFSSNDNKLTKRRSKPSHNLIITTCRYATAIVHSKFPPELVSILNHYLLRSIVRTQNNDLTPQAYVSKNKHIKSLKTSLIPYLIIFRNSSEHFIKFQKKDLSDNSSRQVLEVVISRLSHPAEQSSSNSLKSLSLSP